jgi:hypothetical protein
MNAILSALSVFQETCPPIVRSSSNPFFKSKYASFDDIQKHIKPYLIKSGLVVTQANTVMEGLPYVESVVWHIDSGENIRSVFPVVAGKVSAQDYGSAVSYAKRYSLTGLLNLIIADEDDDGHKASFTVSAGNSITVSNTPPELDQERYDAMVKFITEGKIKEVELAIKKYKLNDSQKKVLTSMINQSKAEAVTKATKK